MSEQETAEYYDFLPQIEQVEFEQELMEIVSRIFFLFEFLQFFNNSTQNFDQLFILLFVNRVSCMCSLHLTRQHK